MSAKTKEGKNIWKGTIERMTVKHIETVRNDIFDASEFLELSRKQCWLFDESFVREDAVALDFVPEGREHVPDAITSRLQSLPLSDEQKHVLYGCVLSRECGGNPDAPLISKIHIITLKKIQKLFLDYPGDTPEKQWII